MSAACHRHSMHSQEAATHRKRRREDVSSCEEQSLRPAAAAKRRKRSPYRLSRRTWESLSKITLTRRALEEFDRRSEAGSILTLVRSGNTSRRLLRSDSRRLEQLSRQGGPDLSSLRGFADHPSVQEEMSQTSSQGGKRGRDSGLPSSRSSFTAKTRTTGPYDPQFEQLLIDNGVYPDGHRTSNGGRPPKPGNIEEIRRRLSQSRPSLSPSKFSEGDFEDFQEINRGTASEAEVMEGVIPIITGGRNRRYYSAANKEFGNMEKFHEDLSTPQPDGYDGARTSEILPQVRTDLKGYIIPSTLTQLPAAPSYFTEVKGQSGRLDVLRRQAMYAGAIGARSMFELQNYKDKSPKYDGNAYTTVSAYHAGNGTLQMYATHPRQSVTGGTEYHMTQLGSYAMTHSPDTFRQGAAALRNARDFSKEQRDHWIASANTTARGLAAATTPSTTTTSGMTVPTSAADKDSDSDTSIDELAPDHDEGPKRKRQESTANSSRPDSQNQPRLSLHSTDDTSETGHRPSMAGKEWVWSGYTFKPRKNGTHEFTCKMGGRVQTFAAKWSPGQECPQIYNKRWANWVQASLEKRSLRVFVRGRWTMLDK